MPTVRDLVSDIELATYQGDISDDIALEKSQIKYWISTDLNSLVANECNEKIKRQEMIPAIYVKRTELEVPDIETDDVDECDERIFLDLPEDVLTINKDMGIVRVITDEGDPILRASLETLDYIRNLRFAKPSANNLVYYHQQKKLFIEGFKPSDIPFNSLFVFYVPKQDLLTMADTDEVLVSDLVLPTLIDSVVNRAKSEIYGSEQDTESDGTDKTQPIYHQQIRKQE